MTNQNPAEAESQFSLANILGSWLAAAIPMLFLTFLIGPAIAPLIGMDVLLTRWLMIIVGLMWPFVLSVIILYRELGTLRWAVIRKRM